MSSAEDLVWIDETFERVHENMAATRERVAFRVLMAGRSIGKELAQAQAVEARCAVDTGLERLEARVANQQCFCAVPRQRKTAQWKQETKGRIRR